MNPFSNQLAQVVQCFTKASFGHHYCVVLWCLLLFYCILGLRCFYFVICFYCMLIDLDVWNICAALWKLPVYKMCYKKYRKLDWIGECGPFKFLSCYAAVSGPWTEALALKWVKPGRGKHWGFDLSPLKLFWSRHANPLKWVQPVSCWN